jgi:class 3 adenylate cyclase
MSTILVVDDQEENRRALQRFLKGERPDWEVITASDEDDAREVLRTRRVGVVVTDLVMGAADSGVRVLEAAKEEQPLTPVIVVTAYEDKLDRYSAFDLGAFDCVAKNAPGVIAAQEVLVKVATAIRFRRSQEQLLYLRRYFDPGVFSTIARDTSVLDLSPRTVTVVFWDIRGFSKVSEQLKGHPQLIAGFLREYFDMAADVVFEHGGVLDKFIGDGVMALFGALEPTIREGRDDAVQAVQAARVLRTRGIDLIEEWKHRWSLYTPEEIECGIGAGLHTGEALVGNVGTERRDQFTALGPHVNFAQRLEGRADPGEIVISASTEARVRDEFDLKALDAIDDVKNIPGQFRLFAVT